MGLITKEVEVRLSGKNISYYESLGYDIPRKSNGKIDLNKCIIVKVEDLSKFSHVYINADCDGCNKPLRMTYNQYNSRNHNGKTYCHPCASKILNSGKNNPNWNPNLTDEERIIGRHYPEYTEFIKRILARDNYTCQVCGQKHGVIEVHHLDGYDWCIEKRIDDTNGITLCEICHSNFHAHYGMGGNTKKQFEEWYGKTIDDLSIYDGEIYSSKKIFCIEENKIYNGYKDLVEAWNCRKSQIYAVCNHRSKHYSIQKKHILWLDEYKKMTKEDVKQFIESSLKKEMINKTPVICLTTGKIYNSMTEAFADTKVHHGDIHRNCTGKRKSAGKLEDGIKLVWMFYDEYLKKIHNGEHINTTPQYNRKKVICTTTGEIFESPNIACEKYQFKKTSRITDVCTNKKKSAGKLPDGTPLVWMYYEDFLKLPKEEQNMILARNQESSNDGSFIMQ